MIEMSKKNFFIHFYVHLSLFYTSALCFSIFFLRKCIFIIQWKNIIKKR